MRSGLEFWNFFAIEIRYVTLLSVEVLLWFHVFLNAIVLGYYCDLAVMYLSSIKINKSCGFVICSLF
jgi:hypothetical protein